MRRGGRSPEGAPPAAAGDPPGPVDALFVIPPTGVFVREARCQGAVSGLVVHTMRAPVEQALHAAILEREGWSCAVLDAPAEGLGPAETLRRIARLAPSHLVVVTTVSTLVRDGAFAAAVEPRPAFVAAVGADFDLDPAGALAALPAFDALVHGDPEAAFLALARTRSWAGCPGVAWREGRDVRVAPGGAAPDLDALPWPALHRVRNGLYLRPDTGRPQTVVVAARGCPGRCSFCLVARRGPVPVRRRSPASLVDEMADRVRRLGIRDFVLMADAFTQDPAWVADLCGRLERARLGARWVCNSRVDAMDDARAAWLRRGGCWGVSLGIESGDDATLRRMGKGTTVVQAREAVGTLRRHGVRSLGYLLIGFPWEDEAAVRRSFGGFLDIDPDFAEILFPYPFPGTRLRAEMDRAGLLAPEDRPDGACAVPAAGTPWIPAARLLELRDELRRRFLLRPRFAARLARQFLSDPPAPAHLLRAGSGWVRRMAAGSRA